MGRYHLRGWGLSLSVIVVEKISSKYNKYMMISRYNDEFKECFELQL